MIKQKFTSYTILNFKLFIFLESIIFNYYYKKK